jgi:malate synthase
MSKLSTENCHRVVARIVTRIAYPENKQTKALASIYTNNLITIIKDVGYEYGYQLKDLVKMIVNAIFNMKSSADPKI